MNQNDSSLHGVFHLSSANRFDVLPEQSRFEFAGIWLTQIHSWKPHFWKIYMLLRGHISKTVEDVLDLGSKDLNAKVLRLKKACQIFSGAETTFV